MSVACNIISLPKGKSFTQQDTALVIKAVVIGTTKNKSDFNYQVQILL
jgi:hypothetical protein